MARVNKQRKYQLRAIRRGTCQKCPRKAVKGRKLCRRCLKVDRERNAKTRRRLLLAAKRVTVKGRRSAKSHPLTKKKHR